MASTVAPLVCEMSQRVSPDLTVYLPAAATLVAAEAVEGAGIMAVCEVASVPPLPNASV